MAFTPKTWVGRSVEHPGRINLISTGTENQFDVERAEGEIYNDGDLVSDVSLNNLEQRIFDAFAGKADGTGGAANNALALGGVDAQSIIDPGHTAESNGYTKLQNGIIIEWLKYNTPVVTANTIYGADITPTHIQNVLCAIGSVIPGTAWDFGPSAVFNLDTSKANLVIKCGTTAQSFSATIIAIGT